MYQISHQKSRMPWDLPSYLLTTLQYQCYFFKHPIGIILVDNLLGTWAIHAPINNSFPKELTIRYYNLERRNRLMPWSGECLRAEATGCPFKEPQNLMSQPSTFLGTQASNRSSPRTLCALILGGVGRWTDLSFRSSCGPGSRPLWYSAELGK